MSVRKIIKIDEEKCDGCGLCAEACHEGAIQIIDEKAKLVSDTYCDGLGDCLSECPQDAITIVEREAKPFDEQAVASHLAVQKKSEAAKPAVGGGCPGSALRSFNQAEQPAPAGSGEPPPSPPSGGCPGKAMKRFDQAASSDAAAAAGTQPSRLGHWPIQLMLVPPGAPFLKNQDLLICADCVPFTVPDFHERYLKGRAVLVGCPKLDDLDFYKEKLTEIFAAAQARSITVLKMEVPCCNGIADAAITARNQSASDTKLAVYTIGLQGALLECEEILAGTIA